MVKDRWPTILPEVSYIMNSITTRVQISHLTELYMESIPLSDTYQELSTRERYDSVFDWVTVLELMEDMINDEEGENLAKLGLI